MRGSTSQGCDLLTLTADRTAVEGEPALAQALDAFDADLYLAGRPATTRQTYRSLLSDLRGDGDSRQNESRRLSGWTIARDPELYVSDLTTAMCRELIAARIRRKQSMATVQTFHGALCAFSNWCVEQHYLSESPMRGIRSPKVKPKPHRYLSVEEMRRLWECAVTSKHADDCLILLLLAEGLRVNELVSLRWQDVREDRIMVMFGKSQTTRAIALSEPLRALLDARQHSETRILGCSTDTVRDRLAMLGRRAHISGVHPHLLRHTFASNALMAGMDSETLRTLGGWSENSEVMQRYVRSVREDAAIARAQEFRLTEKLFGE